MPAAPLPSNERARLAALREYAILDSEAERRYDDIAAVATYVCNTPMAAVSLIDESRQWFKSRIGIDSSETPREEAFCAHAILDDALLVVDDAREDPRFRDNPLVLRNPQVRFYAGAPLVVHGGFRLGTLCAIDTKPRSIDAGQREALARLASAVVTLLELRRTTAQLAMALENVRTLGELIPICSSCHKVRDDQDYWSSLERFVSSRTGSRFTHGLCPGCLTDLYPEIAESVMARVRAKHEQGGGEPTT